MLKSTKSGADAATPMNLLHSRPSTIAARNTRPAMGSMARSEREGNSRGTIATASCEKITRPHDASADHSTSHGDDDDLRSRWSPVASLLIAAGTTYYSAAAASSAPGPSRRAAGGSGGSNRAPAGDDADLDGAREMGAGVE